MLSSGRNKGFIFSVDALVAAFVAIMAIVALAAMLSTSRSEGYEDVPLHRVAQDTLTLLDKNGTLEWTFTHSDEEVRSSLNVSLSKLLPPHIEGRVNITICHYQNPGFDCYRNILYATSENETTIKSVVRRVFTKMSEDEYGIAIMETWYREG